MIYSCESSFKAENPSYIKIDNFLYEDNEQSIIPYSDNYESTNITDAWISMNGQIIGNFEIPSVIPILNEGHNTFDIYPGIKVNGISATRIKYPFYEKFQTELDLNRNQTVSIYPETYYKESTLFHFKEQGTFEVGGTMFETSTTSDTNAIIQSEVVFQGEYSAAIYLDSIHDYFDIRNTSELELTNNTFLELNFKSNINFNIGLLIINNGNAEQKEELIQIYPTENWKKIYLDLGPLVNLGISSSKFKIYLDGQHEQNQANNYIYIDNLKLVYSQ